MTKSVFRDICCIAAVVYLIGGLLGMFFDIPIEPGLLDLMIMKTYGISYNYGFSNAVVAFVFLIIFW